MKAHKLDGSPHCPNCLARLDGVTNVSDFSNHAPEAGDVTICVYCQTSLVFTDKLRLALLTEDMVREMPAELLRELLLVQLAAGKVANELKKGKNN